jgi:hypothetical protein
MATQTKSRNAPVKDLRGPLYLVLDKGGPGLRLRLREGRWLVNPLGPKAVSTILRALECGPDAAGRCRGTCPPGKTCQTIMSLEVDYVGIPEGIPRPPSGREGFVVKRVRKQCRCLAANR